MIVLSQWVALLVASVEVKYDGAVGALRTVRMELHLDVDELNEGRRCDILNILHVFVFLRLNDRVACLGLIVLLASDCLELEAIDVFGSVFLGYVLHCRSALLLLLLLNLLCSE